MALVSCELLWSDRKGGIDKNGQRIYQERYRSITNNVYDGPWTASNSLVIPLRGAYYQTPTEVDYGAYAVDHQITASSESPFEWFIDVRFESALPGEFAGKDVSAPGGGLNDPPTIQTPNPNPLLRRYTLDTDTTTKLVYWTEDLDNDTFNNSAFEPFDSIPGIPTPFQILTFKKNLATFPENVQKSFVNCYNTDIWRGKPPGSCLITRVAGTDSAENNIAFVASTWVIEHCEEIPFHPYWILDQGYKYLNADGRHVHAIDEVTGQNVTKPVLLNGQGGLKNIGDPDVYLPYRIAKPLNFTNNLPF